MEEEEEEREGRPRTSASKSSLSWAAPYKKILALAPSSNPAGGREREGEGERGEEGGGGRDRMEEEAVRSWVVTRDLKVAAASSRGGGGEPPVDFEGEVTSSCLSFMAVT